jgi:hypothetical protein
MLFLGYFLKSSAQPLADCINGFGKGESIKHGMTLRVFVEGQERTTHRVFVEEQERATRRLSRNMFWTERTQLMSWVEGQFWKSRAHNTSNWLFVSFWKQKNRTQHIAFVSRSLGEEERTTHGSFSCDF